MRAAIHFVHEPMSGSQKLEMAQKVCNWLQFSMIKIQKGENWLKKWQQIH